MYCKVTFTQIQSVKKQLWTFSLVYMNDITKRDRTYELVELKMELANCSLPKMSIPIPIRVS